MAGAVSGDGRGRGGRSGVVAAEIPRGTWGGNGGAERLRSDDTEGWALCVCVAVEGACVCIYRDTYVCI